MSEPQRDLSKYIEHIPEEDTTPTPRPRKPKPATREAADVEVEDSGATPLFEQTVTRLFGGDRVLWVIIVALLTISVLVVYSSTAKMAYSYASSITSTEFLKTQIGLILLGGVALVVTHRINSRVYQAISPWVWGAALAMTLAVYFTGSTICGTAVARFGCDEQAIANIDKNMANNNLFIFTTIFGNKYNKNSANIIRFLCHYI